MAAPKKRRSLFKVKRRQNIMFFDSLGGNWNRRREWFYRFLSKVHINSDRDWIPVQFPGFLSGNFFNSLKRLK